MHNKTAATALIAILCFTAFVIAKTSQASTGRRKGAQPLCRRAEYAGMQSSGDDWTAPFDLQFNDTMTMHHKSASRRLSWWKSAPSMPS